MRKTKKAAQHFKNQFSFQYSHHIFQKHHILKKKNRFEVSFQNVVSKHNGKQTTRFLTEIKKIRCVQHLIKLKDFSCYFLKSSSLHTSIFSGYTHVGNPKPRGCELSITINLSNNHVQDECTLLYGTFPEDLDSIVGNQE